ncbi:glycosyl transferase family 2 [Elizabethkingia meningoseptica]|uniref:glycosyltransferase family 2 protein n=1 Tax=Elizabethkingia meningoseptica TaxID=238 RepID=UPI000998ED4F|nr:glycosyltransferase [Elizabethkingia meningoseptica]OPC02944.1 glycosyl transferase family 2 [Elizabethkingia meningoseptica]
MEKKNVRVSVIIPVYNVEAFLDETIQSVLEQSLDSVEVILVNDGSTDNSAQIGEKYAAANPNVKFISQENKGVSVARNKGLEKAEGEYIFFMDSDDTLDKEYLKTSYETAKNNDSDIVVIGNYFYTRMQRTAILPTCAQFLKHGFLKKYPDIRFPVNIQPCEDGIFSNQLLALTSKVSYNRQGVYHYRKHDKQNHVAINQNAGKVLLQIPEWLEILRSSYTKYDLIKSRALYLALFVQHEPFGFRYLKMPLDKDQKVFLHRTIKVFMEQDVLPYLTKKDMSELSRVFVKFINAQTYEEFDVYFADSAFNQNNKFKNKVYMKMTKFIINTKARKRLKNYLKGEF